MICLELSIPPIPQFIKIGNSILKQGFVHPERYFPIFDMIIVNSGMFFIEEEGIHYQLQEGSLLVLEPNHQHRGVQQSSNHTEIFWIHFKHPFPVKKLSNQDIAWSTLITQKTDQDLEPAEQYMYIPKYTRLDMNIILPTLRKLVALHTKFSYQNALHIQALQTELFLSLQSIARTQHRPRSLDISDAVIEYLSQTYTQPITALKIEKELNFNFDYLSRCVKKHTGLSPIQYLQRVRIKEAKEMLMHSNEPINAIADKVGIPNYNYFIRLFKKIEGITPGSYREQKDKLFQ
jgi:AraC-like DNA-binding protein